MIKNSAIAFVFVFALMFLSLISLTYAGEVSLYCLKNGQTLEFSKCNPNMQNYYCDSSLCQICAEKTNNIYCPKNPNICNSLGEGCKYLDEEISGDALPSPYIALLNPADGYAKDDPATIEFSFKIAEKSYMYQICELLLDGESVASKIKPISTSTQKLSVPVGTGPHEWKIKCTKTSSYGGGTEISGKRNLFVNMDEFIPEILLTSPDNDFSTTENELTFSYIFSEQPYNIESCSLKLNEEVYDVELSGGLSNSYSQLVSPGSYTWNVECIINGNNVVSESRSLIISEVPVVNSGGGDSGGGGSSGGGGGSSGGGGGGGSGGGGGGGSGICTTQWNCTEWSECVDNQQSRICSKVKETCNAGEKPFEEQECETVVENTGEKTEENQEDEKSFNIFQKALAGITGAAVGAKENVGKNKIIFSLGFVIIIIGIGTLIYFYKPIGRLYHNFIRKK